MIGLGCIGFGIALFLGFRWSEHDASWDRLTNAVWIMVILVVMMAVIAVWDGTPASAVAVPAESRAVLDPATPSFYFIVLDGYAGAYAELPELSPVVNQFVDELGARGFAQTAQPSANYNTTYASLSTALSLDHEITFSSEGLVQAFQKVRGDNRLVREMQENGYRYVHIESGFRGSVCGSMVDLCYQGLLFEETLEGLVDLSLMSRWWTQSAYTSGAFHSFESLATHMAQDSGGDFVFAHILLPHPPLVLSSTCEARYQPELDVRWLHPPRATTDELEMTKSAYVEQIQCVNNLMLDLMDRLPPNARVVITSDHGTDLRGQHLKLPEHWDAADIAERFSIFNVTRLPRGCRVGPPTDLINIMRASASCILGAEFAPVSERHEIVPYYGDLELEPRFLTLSDMGF
jgi:hypothetical protein